MTCSSARRSRGRTCTGSSPRTGQAHAGGRLVVAGLASGPMPPTLPAHVLRIGALDRPALVRLVADARMLLLPVAGRGFRPARRGGDGARRAGGHVGRPRRPGRGHGWGRAAGSTPPTPPPSPAPSPPSRRPGDPALRARIGGGAGRVRARLFDPGRFAARLDQVLAATMATWQAHQPVRGPCTRTLIGQGPSANSRRMDGFSFLPSTTRPGPPRLHRGTAPRRATPAAVPWPAQAAAVPARRGAADRDRRHLLPGVSPPTNTCPNCASWCAAGRARSQACCPT